VLAFSEYTQFFIAMLAIVDPVTALPFYLHLVRKRGIDEQSRFALNIALTTTIALILTVFIGQKMLNFFGISIGAFQIAGGLLLLLLALQLIKQKEGGVVDEVGATELTSDQVIVPIAIPLLAGPGAFSTVIVFSFRSQAWSHLFMLSACILVLGLIVWLSLRVANRFMALLSLTSIAIINKIMGLILASIAIEFLVAGIKAKFAF
jgi:multiple antibiotic resistance protein